MYQEIQSKEVTKRKKSTRCMWCGEKIEIGDRANYRAYIFDGFQTEYNHPECFEAMGNLMHDVSRDDYYDYCQDGWEPMSWFRGTTKSRNE